MIRLLIASLVLLTASSAYAEKFVVTVGSPKAMAEGFTFNAGDFEKFAYGGEDGRRVLVVVEKATGIWYRIEVTTGTGKPPAVDPLPVDEVEILPVPPPIPPADEAKTQPASEAKALPVPQAGAKILPTVPPAVEKPTTDKPCRCCQTILERLEAIEAQLAKPETVHVADDIREQIRRLANEVQR